MKKLIVPILIAMLSARVSAQTSLSLYYMESVPQSSALNPARAPRGNVFVGLHGTNISMRTETKIKMSQLFQKTDGQWHFITEREFDYKKINRRFKKGARLNEQLSIGLINFGWRKDDSYLTFDLNTRIEAGATLPSGLFKILDNGMPDGSRRNFKSLRVCTQAYHELAFGYSLKLDKQLSVGAKIKYLSGIAAARTRIKKFEATSSLDALNINVNGKFDMSLPVQISPKDDGTVSIDSIEMKDLATGEIIARSLPGFHNPGVAADIGAEYKIDERFKVSGSITDLGLIVWTKDLNNIKVKNSYRYSGVNIEFDEFFDGIEFADKFDEIGDTLKNSFAAHASNKMFVTGTRPNLYIGGEYTPFRFMTVGVVSRTTFWLHNMTQNFNFTLNMKPFTYVSVMNGFNIDLKGCLTADFGFSVNMGVVQYYFMANGLPIFYRHITIDGEKTIVPYNLCDLGISTGFNIIIGAKGPKIKSLSKFRS